MTGALMGFPQTSSGVVGNTNYGFIVDNRFGNAYGVSAPGSPGGIRKWDIWPQGLERLARSTTDLGTTQLYLNNTLTYRSQELVVAGGAANSDILSGFDMGTLSRTGTFGIENSSLQPSTISRILAPSQMCCFQAGFGSLRSDTILCTTITATQELNQVSWGRKINTRTTITETDSVVGALPDGSGTNAWAFGINVVTTGACTLYRVTSGKNTIVGTISPAQLDAQWTNFTGCAGISVDQTDGQPILMLSTTDTATNKCYFVKLSAVNASVVWKAAVTGGINYSLADMPKNVIKNSTLYYLGPGDLLWTLNTSSGAISSVAIATAEVQSINGRQMSEDVSGSVMWYGTFADAGLSPTYLGNYCLTLGNHSGANMGWRFWPGGTPNPAPSYASPAMSRKRAWSFVLDGHTFYVMDMGSEGTFVYDTITQQWAQFVTQGYVQWNFANGVMWGQRIVAGDLLTTDVWEMTPGSLFDNGATEITHVVTGGIITRNRIFHSVDQFSLACSSGLLQDGGAAASVTLLFSDNQGQTWTTMDTQTLTEGDFGAEITWRSLGAFNSPGRIFKITDTGGFLRIDGADAGIDGFDAATADTSGS